jgi:murein DD-endopeptidase MepM/ murein hydrolase activator NlpD
VQDEGWQGWKTSGQTAGTVGESKRMEAVEIKLSGTLASYFDVYYRVHCEDYGWLGWASNGESAGTVGGKKRMEAIQVKLVQKGVSVDKGGTAFYDLSSTSSGGNSSDTSAALTSPVPSGSRFNTKTSDSGWYGYHDININVSTSTPVYAIADGTVTYKQAYRTYSGVKYLTSYGNFIEFKSSDRKYTAKYCHLSAFNGVNQRISSSRTKQVSGSEGVYTLVTKSVKKGDTLGYIGKTGNATGVHLHFELYQNGSRIDPTSVISGLK